MSNRFQTGLSVFAIVLSVAALYLSHRDSGEANRIANEALSASRQGTYAVDLQIRYFDQSQKSTITSTANNVDGKANTRVVALSEIDNNFWIRVSVTNTSTIPITVTNIGLPGKDEEDGVWIRNVNYTKPSDCNTVSKGDVRCYTFPVALPPGEACLFWWRLSWAVKELIADEGVSPVRVGISVSPTRDETQIFATNLAVH
ncbi:hypothetical protein QSJ18_19320 [Gordonia sp. ABSL1-1]|uniref:hypothetical protein n=1 Tax=Gordonia sp. ABSL1-1 TaxID=3053923 RepID=UPI0025746A12|nr:hypothetical protein [Gordonia sp. ABSL1-1]MDL9938902.1 hypothetical protein [Gordonia sp. ABSL1-1]